MSEKQEAGAEASIEMGEVATLPINDIRSADPVMTGSPNGNPEIDDTTKTGNISATDRMVTDSTPPNPEIDGAANVGPDQDNPSTTKHMGASSTHGDLEINHTMRTQIEGI